MDRAFFSHGADPVKVMSGVFEGRRRSNAFANHATSFCIYVELMLHLTLAFGAEFSVGVRDTNLLIASLLRKAQCNMKSDIFIVRDWEQGQSLTIIPRCFFEQRCLEFVTLFFNDFLILLVAQES